MTINPFNPAEMVGPTLSQDGKGEFRCPECGNRCTRGPSGKEYGHARGNRVDQERCSRRPESVDPQSPRKGGSDG